jgi:hypothetical protein
VPRNGFAYLRGRLAEFCLLVCEQAFFGAGGALGAMQALETTAQAGVAQGAVAAAVAGKLIDNAADFGHLLIDVLLPVVLEVVPGQLVSGKDGRQGADFEWRGRVIRGNIVSGIGKLRIAGRSEREDAQCQEQSPMGKLFHQGSHCGYSIGTRVELNLNWINRMAGEGYGFAEFRRQKKTARTFSVRAGRPVTQLTSNSGEAISATSQTGIYTP